jgi:hypothetical protein
MRRGNLYPAFALSFGQPGVVIFPFSPRRAYFDDQEVVVVHQVPFGKNR